MESHLPAFEQTLHVGRPNLGDLEVFRRLSEEILARRWFSNHGVVVQEFEARLCDYLGVRHCIPVCNGTVGLQIACQALGLQGEVIVPAFTFVATAHALQWEGIQPVFVDINPHTHHLDVEKIEALITPKTTAIVGVHIWGRPCDTAAIEAIARQHNLVVLYDAAHAFGCDHLGQKIGNFGACEVFSFHATKFFNTFEGGAIATNDDGLAHRIRLMKNFGFSGMDNVVHLGTNGKMPEICAAMGLACFEVLDNILAVNRENYETYQEVLAAIPGVKTIGYDDLEATNYQYIIVEVHEEQAGISRDELMTTLHRENIRARRYFYPGCHRMEPYRTLYPHQCETLPLTDLTCSRILILPTGTAVNPQDIQVIGGVIRGIVGNHGKRNVD